jgi:hypothetical protein
MLAYATPASGAVLVPVNNFAMRDREAGTIAANSSVGAWKKLERIRANPKVALAYHTRLHAQSERPELVLAQGDATLSEPIPEYPAKVAEHWARFETWPPRNPLWRWWQRYYALRVEIEIAVRRLVVWPDLRCQGEPRVIGEPRPQGGPPSQRSPGKGTGPRLDAAKAAGRVATLPHTLLGWIGPDGYPETAPVEVTGSGTEGIELRAPAGLVPAGERRAGLSAHWFSRGAIGQNQRKYTGWLSAREDGELLYAPHTEAGYRFPESRTLYRIASGGSARLGLRGARGAGLL